ncbi:MAG: acyl-CoA dehydrogenase family protein [Deltaproteobacteria bacterium]|nr:acyl-CoA dehydrogenase family protein [Deltaproteobacteria bacterium]
MAYDADLGRDDLETFDGAQPDNFWRADPHLRRVLARLAGETTLAGWETQLDQFGAECAGGIDAAVRLNNLGHNLPTLDRFDGFGARLEAVEHHPSFHIAGRGIYGSGVMKALTEAHGNVKSLAMFYLSSHNGEGGHNCPLACTAGAIKAIRALGSAVVRDRYLPRLLSTDYQTLAHGAQFLTEVQGGSDVGANSVRALPSDDASLTFALHGEKWFCSNVTADLVVVTARLEGAAEGTEGLGMFLMPRRLPDGSLNRFTIRRLKDKIGTRTLPTAELDLNGALAYPLGPTEGAFKNVMTYVINTSRLFNAVGCCGMARRAGLVAHGYAAHRKAFGRPIAHYPMVADILATMRAQTAAMTSGTFYLAAQADRIEQGDADAETRGFWRMAVNLNKMRTALTAHEVIQSGLEILGGNGTIETFSVLPRLLRDNVVFENWEGSHNVLLLQVLRDCKTKRLHQAFFAHLATLGGNPDRIRTAAAAARSELEAALAGDEALATLVIRRLGSRIAYLFWAAAMHADGTEPALIDHFLDHAIGPQPAQDAAYARRIAALAQVP